MADSPTDPTASVKESPRKTPVFPVIGALISLAVVVIAVIQTAGTPGPVKQSLASAPPITVLGKVRYKISGTSWRVNITLRSPTGIQQMNDVASPSEMSAEVPRGESLLRAWENFGRIDLEREAARGPGIGPIWP
jgi:hypothetical protein